ncbi:MAG: SMP-30/gluconolactonase/LRE family protein [Pseudomonadota bacterium]
MPSLCLPPRHELIQAEALEPPFAGIHVWPVQNRVGESPVWDDQNQVLFWIDVRAPAVLRLDPATGALTRWLLPEVVGALGLAAKGKVVLALENRLAILDPSTDELHLWPAIVHEPAHNRLNEGKVSPGGRWFVFGSMDDRADNKQPTGALYRSATDGSMLRLHQGLTVANGIAWSPDAQWIYFSDSYAGLIWRARWNEALGEMGTPELFAASNEESGRPDGALVDSAGNYLSAGVSAACLNSFDPDGVLVGKRLLPVRAPSMPCLGGRQRQRLFVTSLVRPGWDNSQTLDGCLLEMPAPCAAWPAVCWNLAS